MDEKRQLLTDVLSTYYEYVDLDDWSKLEGIDEFLFKVERLGYTGKVNLLRGGKIHSNSRTQLSEIFNYVKGLDIQEFDERLDNHMRNTIFISHSTENAIIANHIKDFIHAIGQERKLVVFCSSDKTSIAYDGRFNQIILDALSKTKLAISILSKDYVKSEYCLMELGYFHFTSDSEITLTSCTLDDYKDTIAVLEPIRTKQTALFEKTRRESISNYLDYLKSTMSSEFDLELIPNISIKINEYVDKIIDDL